MGEMIQLINRIGDGFIQFNLTMLIQSGILISILLILDWFLHKRVRAIFRYWIWILVLVKLVLPVQLALPTSPMYWAPAPEQRVVSQMPEVEEAVLPKPKPAIQGLAGTHSDASAPR